MKTKRVGWLLIFLSYVGVVLAQNLDDQERRWAISGSWGGNWPIVTKNTLSGKAVSAGHIHTLMLEYYISYTRFSLKGGYTGEEIGLNPGISASMSNLGNRRAVLFLTTTVCNPTLWGTFYWMEPLSTKAGGDGQ